MGITLQRILNYLGSSRLSKTEHIPILWEDDYCQVELIPQENFPFVQQQMIEVKSFAEKHSTDLGYTDISEREDNPTKILSLELRADYLKRALTAFGLPELHKMRYEGGEIRTIRNSNTKAVGFPSFTLFFETEDEFVKNIWLKLSLITSVDEYETILTALYYLGEETKLLLVDWNACEAIDLTDKVQINKYLMGWWK